jgi:hypothetical protein
MSIKFKDILLKEGYKGNMITGELPKRLDNTLFTLIHVLGGFDTSDVINFASNANHREKKLLSKMVDDLRLYDNVGVRGFDKESIKNSSRYRALTIFLKTIADTGGVNSLTEQISTTDPYFSDYVKPEYKKLIFKQWDKLGKADYNVLKYFDVVGEDKAFDNVADVVYPILALEWLGGVENTDFAQAPWMETSEMGFNKLRFKVEPVGFDYLYDESDNFGERGYSCWDIRVLIDVNETASGGGWGTIDQLKELFPESARNKLSSFRNYTHDQNDLIESLWNQYDSYRDLVSSFCRVEVVLV